VSLRILPHPSTSLCIPLFCARSRGTRLRPLFKKKVQSTFCSTCFVRGARKTLAVRVLNPKTLAVRVLNPKTLKLLRRRGTRGRGAGAARAPRGGRGGRAAARGGAAGASPARARFCKVAASALEGIAFFSFCFLATVVLERPSSLSATLHSPLPPSRRRRWRPARSARARSSSRWPPRGAWWRPLWATSPRQKWTPAPSAVRSRCL